MRVAVIGAGPGGLVSTKSLSEQGLDVTCFEMSSCVGGHWRLDNPNGRSAAYESLTTNTTKKMSRLSDYEMPMDWPECWARKTNKSKKACPSRWEPCRA